MYVQRLTRLTREDSIELGKRMSNGDNKAREELILSCVPLVNSITNIFLKSFVAKNSSQCYSTYDDVFQDGMLGVLEAVDIYDYEKKVAFTTFAYYYIYKRIYAGIVKQTPVKISSEDFYSIILLNSTIESFQEAYHVSPTNEQLSKLTSIPLNQVIFLRNRNLKEMVVSFDDFDEETDKIDVVLSTNKLPSGDMSYIVEKALNQQMQKDIIDNALETLSEEEREIIIKRYLYPNKKASLKELASLQGVCFQMIAKREKKALKKLLLFFVNHGISFDDLV